MVVLGNTLIIVACISSVLSAVSFYRASASNPALLNRARRWLTISMASIAAMSFLLLTQIVMNDFSNGYVYSYSSRSLPLHFLLSSFYAGQEGSFLFWALCSAIIGFFLMRYTRARNSEPWVMTVYMGVQSFLLLLLFVKTPFISVWMRVPDIAAGQIPADGSGLNPLLQNFWMVIHPPVLFVGFAAMAVPFAFAVASMWKKNSAWMSTQLSGWLLFAVVVLGAGIMLGAYWAYGVLGWGGYWGWDPVENSSLVPWIVGVALLHTLIVQKRTGRFVRASLALAILSFLFVIYSTFLTRSGVLGDSSVHSFTDAGAGVYWLLIGFLAAIAGVGFGFMYYRRRALRPVSSNTPPVNKESVLAAGAVALVHSAGIVLFGTSLPLVGNSSVDASFYNTMNIPIAVATMLCIGFSLYSQWGVDTATGVFKRSLKWLALCMAAAIGLYILGVDDTPTLTLSMAALFAIVVNVEFAWRQGRVDLKATGGKLAHIGFGIFLIGAVVSGRYGTTQQVSLTRNEPVDVLGYTLTYVGYAPTADGKFAFNVNTVKDGKVIQLSPVMFDAGRQGTMKNPDIASFVSGDFYIAPVSLEETQDDHSSHAGDVYTIEKGKSTPVGTLTATFVRFEMNAHGGSATLNDAGGEMAVGSILEVTDGKTTETITPVTVYSEGGRQISRPTESKLMKATVQLLSMNVGGMGTSNPSTITIGVQGAQQSHRHGEALIIEASVKPLMWLVWLGTFVVLAGFTMAMMHRLREA